MPDPDPSPFDELVGIEWVELEPERARAQLELASDHRQPFGLVHGGVLSTMVESICSRFDRARRGVASHRSGW
jgi:1,4-dihydroxy-2-naphthoyl-CoA hydrolase